MSEPVLPSLESKNWVIEISHYGTEEDRNRIFSRVIQSVRELHGRQTNIRRDGMTLQLRPPRKTFDMVKSTATLAMNGMTRRGVRARRHVSHGKGRSPKK